MKNFLYIECIRKFIIILNIYRNFFRPYDEPNPIYDFDHVRITLHRNNI